MTKGLNAKKAAKKPGKTVIEKRKLKQAKKAGK